MRCGRPSWHAPSTRAALQAGTWAVCRGPKRPDTSFVVVLVGHALVGGGADVQCYCSVAPARPSSLPGLVLFPSPAAYYGVASSRRRLLCCVAGKTRRCNRVRAVVYDTVAPSTRILNSYDPFRRSSPVYHRNVTDIRVPPWDNIKPHNVGGHKHVTDSAYMP